jgi:RND family efflux transporter MFP subunit
MKKMYLFALTVTLIVTSCGQKKGEDIPLVRPVKTATVSSQSVILKDFSGMVEAVEYVKLAFRVSGQIIDLPVVEGQRVRKGQLIAAIDPRDISLQYAADKAAYETAAAQVERNKRLLGRQAISLQEYEISVANYQKAKSAYELSTNNMRDTKLLAPFDGSIEKRLVENYQRVNSGEGIVRLVNTQKLRIKFTIPDDYLYLLRAKDARWSSIRTKAIYSMPDWKSILTYRPTARVFRLPSPSTTPPSTVPYTM